MKENIELLAPAGNIESFKAAVNSGADAIYMGLGKHNARVMAKNFTLQDYKECIDYAHIRGVKVYLTLNTLVLDSEIKEAMDMLIELYACGLDAVILQDIGLAMLIHKIMPELHMHASTQMSAYSLEQVNFLEKIGFKRVVLARELTLDEIRYITENSKVEIEAFVHGALCVCVSGQCLLSQSIGNRSANRGACAQPCRMKYSLCSQEEVIENNTYLLSKKDIFGLDLIDKILESNITSLKIEGRNKSPEYVALVVSLYRKYIDEYIKTGKCEINPEDEKNIIQMFNRNGKSHGYLDGIKYKNSITLLSPKNTGIYLGEVLEKKGNYIKVKLNENLNLHDGIEIYSKPSVISSLVTCIKDEKMKLINSNVKKGSIVYIGDIKTDTIKKMDKVYKTSSYTLNAKVQEKYIRKPIRKRNMTLNVNIKKDSPVTLSVIVNDEMYTYNTNIIPEKALNKELTLESLAQTFSKTQDYGVSFNKVIGYVEKGLFLKVSVLNEIRRNFVNKIEEKLCTRRDTIDIKNRLDKVLCDYIKYEKVSSNILKSKNILSVYKYDSNIDYVKEYQNKYNKKIERIDFNISDYIKYEEDILHKYSKYNLGINIPNFVLSNLDRYIKGNLERLLQNGVKTIILGSFRYYELIKRLKDKYDITLIADYSFNISNSYSTKFFIDLGFDIVVPSFDCTQEQIQKINMLANVELVDDYITVMTSRYCILGSFVANRKEGEYCTAPCIKNRYYLLDTYNERYDIVSDCTDCVMKIVKKHRLNLDNINANKLSIRNNVI